jgi:hypothetical protein
MYCLNLFAGILVNFYFRSLQKREKKKVFYLYQYNITSIVF